MADIFGRSTRIKPGVTITSVRQFVKTKLVSSLEEIKNDIKEEFQRRLNLVDVDPGEIVVFETGAGKLKTSNISLDDLLVKQPTADDDSIVVFQKGKLAPGVIMSKITNKLAEFDQFLSDFLGGPHQPVIQVAIIKNAIDNLERLRTDHDTHINQFLSLRRNFSLTDAAIEKFFEKKNPTPDHVKILQSEIIDFQRKTINDINSATETINNNYLQITNKIADIEKKINESGGAILPAETVEKLNKIKIAHSADRFKQIVHVVESATLNYENSYGATIAETNQLGFLYRKNVAEFVGVGEVDAGGIYRFTIVSSKQFNIEVVNNRTGITITKGIDTVTFIMGFNVTFRYIPVDGKPDTVSITYVIEYLGVP